MQELRIDDHLKWNAARIKSSLSRLRESGASVFGSETHGFHLNAPLKESAVLAFEQTHRIHLPVDYRTFITRIGNGGAGPFYGVFPLGKRDSSFGSDLEEWHENDGFMGILSKPFPHEKDWNDLNRMPQHELAESAPEAYEKQQDDFDNQYWSSALVNGAIPICHEGCAIRIWLVVTGPQTGYLWRDTRSEFTGIRPLKLQNGNPATFTTWYEEWLQTALGDNLR